MSSATDHAIDPKSRALLRRPAVFRLLLVALLAEIGYAVLNISTMPVYLKSERGFGEFSISLIITAFLFSEAVLKGPMGHAADRFGCRRFLILGPALTLVTSLLSLAVPHDGGRWEVWAFVALRVLDGVGAAMLWPAMFAQISHTVKDEERQQGMSLMNSCYLFGIAIALPIGGVAEDLSGHKSAGLYLAALLFLAVVLAATFLISDPPVTAGPDDEVVTEGFQWKAFVASARLIPGYLAIAVMVFIGVGFPMANLKNFALAQFNMSGSQFGALVLPGAIAMALLSVPMSKVGERIGLARAVHIGIGACALGVGLIGSAAVVPALRTPWILAVCGIPVGLGFLLAIPAWLTAVSDLDPQRRAANLGAVMTAQGLGAIIGVPLGGLAYERMRPLGEQLGFGQSMGYYAPFVGCAVCLTLGWLLSLRLLRDRPSAA